MESRPAIRTPDQRLRVFVSSTLGEMAAERGAVRSAIERLRLAPVMFELGARPHPPRELYRAYLAQSHVFVGMYWQRYGWVAPGEAVSGLEDEYRLAGDMPRLLYIKEPSPERERGLVDLLRDIKSDDRASYRRFNSVEELERLVVDDLSLLLSERFEGAQRNGLRVLPAYPADVPRPLTATVGREDDLDAAIGRLRGGARLVTLTGPGGIGKSRLALEVARAVRDDYPDGVSFVPLAAVVEPRLVADTIAERLGVRLEGARDAPHALADHFAARRALLVLDNLEQVIAAGADLAALLERAPNLAMLVTSRRPLRVRGEQEQLLGPLAVPPPGATADEVAASAAVQLFVDRAIDVHAGFALTAGNAEDVAELCRRLDGLPLALEIAAARVRLLSPEALLRRLAGHLDLGSGRTDLPERQRTLRATIDWSYDLLDERERSMFCRFSVFAGGATLDAAERVCAEPGGDAIETLAGLLDKSLLVDTDDPRGGEPRLRMLETVRSYAWEKLVERGEAEDLRRRHLAYFSELGRHAQPYLCGPGQREWSARFDPERANVRAAINAGFDMGELSVVLQLTWDTFVYYYIRDAFQEPREWVERIVAHRQRLDEVDRANLDVGLVIAGSTVGGFDAPSRLAAAVPVLEVHASRLEAAVAHFYLGLVHWQARDAAAAIQELRASSRGYDALDHDWGVAIAETTLGAILTATESGSAASHHQRALDHARKIDNRPLIVQALQGLALLDALAARPEPALERLEEAAHLAWSERWASGASYCLDALAVIALRLGAADDAIRALAGSDAVRTRLQTPGWTAFEQVVGPLAATVRSETPQDVYARLWDAGRRADPFVLLDTTLAALRSAPRTAPEQ